MPIPERITNYAERGLSRLLSQFRGKPNWTKLIQIMMDRPDGYSDAHYNLQEIENILYDLIEKRFLSKAEGMQLDLIGYFLGLARPHGLNDEKYRTLLRNQI